MISLYLVVNGEFLFRLHELLNEPAFRLVFYLSGLFIRLTRVSRSALLVDCFRDFRPIY